MSIWSKYENNMVFPSLEKNIEVDTLIIGGGISGLTSFYYLKDMPSICLVDAKRIGMGVTKNTMGKLNYLQGTIYTELQNNISYSIAKEYLKSQKYAISLALEIINKEKINCDLEQVSAYIFTNKQNEIKKIQQEKEFLEEQEIKVNENKLPIDIPSKFSISVSDTYVFNPIKYINHLKELLKAKQIYENTKIIKIENQNDQYICFTKNNKIIAKRVIVACHYPFFIFPFLLPFKSHIEKSYMIACKVKENKKMSCISLSNPAISIRYYQDDENIYKLYLASSHATAFKQNDKQNFLHVQECFSIEEKDIIAKWSNVDIITDDKLSYIGEIKKNLYIETGFNTWGMTNGILASKIISDSILGRKNPYSDIFKLNRYNFYKIKSFFSNTISSIITFIGSKKHNKSWYSNKIKIKKINGKKVAIYTDDDGIKHIVYTTCPHAKCSLVFNEVEKTWDCPCHSSRFDLDGNCIKGPSLYNISYKK